MAKVEPLHRKGGLIRPAARPIIDLNPNDVREFVNTKEYDLHRVRHTPDIARVCLELNRPDQRAVSLYKLAQITRDMANATFLENGDTIKFGWDGFMYDGQKRNRGVIASDTTQILTWAIGLDPAAHFVTDKGQKRSLSDSLRIEGYNYYTNTAAAGSWLYILKYCNSEDSGFRLKSRLGSDEEIYTLIKQNPKLTDSVSAVCNMLPGRRQFIASRSILIPASLLIVIHYLASEFLHKREEVGAFVNTVAKFPLEVAYPHAVDDAQKGFYNPLNLWLKYLHDRKESKTYVSREAMGTGTLQAWDLYASGRRLRPKDFKLSTFHAMEGLDISQI